MGWRTGGDFDIVDVVPELLVLELLMCEEEKMVAEAIFRADRALYSSG